MGTGTDRVSSLARSFLADVLYDMVHYFSHHMRVSEGYLADMKKYHLAHHYQSESSCLT